MDEPIDPAVFDPIGRLLDRLSVDSVFGAPTHVGDVTVIPVAKIRSSFAFGAGSGNWRQQPGADKPFGGRGGGGGGGGRAQPMGFIRVAPDGVQYEPMFDPIRVPLAAFMLAAWIVYWITHTIRSCRQAA